MKQNNFSVWLKDKVSEYKKEQFFYTDAKIKDTTGNLTVYLMKNNIDTVILGISGGIDSSLVLAVLVDIKKNHLPLLKIHAVNIHFSCYDGIFDFRYIDLLKRKYKKDGVIFHDVDGTNSIQAIFDDLKFDANCKNLMAQSSYALRYQMLFTYSQMYSGVTIGTTNKDEFSYVGWFGKNSDMVVDLQILQNFHKFEVVYWAEKLGVPYEIISRVPVGDLIDHSSDEDNFGCSYDELAWYSAVGKIYKDDFITKQGDLILKKNFEFHEDLVKKFEKVEALRKKNAHKYQGQGFNPIFI